MIKKNILCLLGKLSVGGLCVLLGVLMLIDPVHAYLDSGTLSILLQSILAGLAAMVVSISLFWAKIRKFIAGDKDEPKNKKKSKD